MDFPFGAYAPDQGEFTPGAMMQADGCIPLAEGYGPFPSLTVASSAGALSSAPRGLFSYQKADGSWQIVAATVDSILLMAADYTFSSIDTGLTVSPGDDVCFEKFGTRLLYTDILDGLRAYDVEAGGAASAVAAANNPRVICECGNILFAGDTLDQGGTRNNRFLRSSARGEYSNFTTRGANFQELQTGGAIVSIGRLSDTAAFLLQSAALKLIQIGGVGSSLWNWISVSEKFGSVGAKSVVPFDGAVYYLATDGFRRFSLGGGIEQIGDGLVDQTFLASVDQSDLSLVQGTVDPFRKLVLWRYKRTADASQTVFEKVIGYSWAKKRWFTFTVQTAYLGFSAQAALTWDAYVGVWDDQNIAWDSRALQGGQPLFGAFDASFKFGYFAGPSMAATLETAIADSPTTELINWAKPIDNCATGTLELGVKDQLSDTTAWKTGASKVASGRVPLRGRGEEIAFRRNIPAGATWTYAKGVDHVSAQAGGPR